ncbi:unnamed protein product [Cylicostephanus goldi]|uniref:ATP-dependent DNA helicase n=1 Tax=Cylicostephanus goldi TaxID=71465 RepID=A0A3P6QS22_CYLGO|nr:unnamed protein product [Cylicostephanus goldi]
MDKLLEEHDDDCNPCVSSIDDNEGMSVGPVVYDLNKKQEEIVTRVTSAAKSGKTSKDRVFFVYRKAGCGETCTFNVLIHVLESSGFIIAVASTWKAVTLLKDGQNCQIGQIAKQDGQIRQLNSDSVANVDASVQGKMLRDIDVIVWDEISMQTRYAVECMDRLLCGCTR